MANYLPATYNQTYGYGNVGQQMYPQYQGGQQQSYAAQPQTASQQNGPGIIWVDGEVGAKAYQMPNGWPCNQPIALWDTNDTVIYLKSINPMGMPNPLQKAVYKLEEYRSASPMNRMSGDAEPGQTHDMSEYVRKDEMERMKQEIMDAIGNAGTGGNGQTRRTAKGE